MLRQSSCNTIICNLFLLKSILEKINGKKVQEIDIYYRGVGIISFPVNLDDIEVTIEKILNKKTA